MNLPPWPAFETDERIAASEALRTGRVNYWTGTACRDFEGAWSAAHGGIHSIAMANGSLTLDAALRVLGIGPGDEVIVSPRSYVASAMCVCLAGATPVFADVDPDSGCITPDTADAVRTPRTRAVIPVHVGGWPCDMPALMRWAAQHRLAVIEDCAQAHGADIDGQPVGTFGTFASWSFCQDKIMTTGGEGGMLCTQDPALYKRCWAFAQHGKDHDLALELHGRASTPGFKWLVNHEGTNCRMTEMQAAIGLVQLGKLQTWLDARRRNALILADALSGLEGMRVPSSPRGHAFYRFTCYIEGTDLNGNPLRDMVLRELHDAGVPATVGSCGEIYREPYFERRGLAPRERLPNARRLMDSSLSLFTHHTIGEADARQYAADVRRIVAAVLAQPLRRVTSLQPARA